MSKSLRRWVQRSRPSSHSFTGHTNASARRQKGVAWMFHPRRKAMNNPKNNDGQLTPHRGGDGDAADESADVSERELAEAEAWLRPFMTLAGTAGDTRA